MKTRAMFKMMMLVLLAVTVSFGCAKKNVETPADTGSSSSSGSGSGSGSTSTNGGGMDNTDVMAQKLEEAKKTITGELVYFDFDKFDLKPQYREVLKKKAELLKDKDLAALRVLIEGHCDERGTEEYNLALGERRARAVYEFLILLGVDASRLDLVSYGEERPALSGSNEATWAKNRRAEFKIIQ